MRHDVTVETIHADWRVSREAELAAIQVGETDLIVMRDLHGERAGISPGQALEAQGMRARVAELNAAVRIADIRGCFAPAFRRVFRGDDLRLHGRFYAIGGSNFQNQPREDRPQITIGGQGTTEVDLHASFLTIFLGLTGSRELTAQDLYSAIGPPRNAVKAWFVRTVGNGRLVTRWDAETSPEVLRVRPTDIRNAALRAYPALADLTAILPHDLRRTLPEERHQWAAGQYLANVESRVMDAALLDLRRREIVGPPLHDAIIVAESAVPAATTALKEAMREAVGLVPIVKHH